MAGFDYQTEIDNIVSILQAHNTTTASPVLGQSLTAAINSDDILNLTLERMPVRGDRLPAIFIEVEKADETFQSIGPTGANNNLKEKVVQFRVYGVYPKSGGSSAMLGNEKDVLNEVYRLARNIEAVFQQELTLGGRACWCNADNTTFSPGLQITDGTMVKVCDITLTAKYMFR